MPCWWENLLCFLINVTDFATIDAINDNSNSSSISSSLHREKKEEKKQYHAGVMTWIAI